LIGDQPVAGTASYLGTLTPRFVLGLLIMIFFVRHLGYWTGLQWMCILPSPGLPEPREIIAPALTLAARPVAYIAQVTSIQIQEQLRASFV
jgi:ABC-type dipeptide/oligopeptide/nickel transport system permease component